MKLPLAWITGAGGLIGNYLFRLAPALAPAYRVRPILRPDLDLLDAKAVSHQFQTDNPTLVIHCAALTRNPDCTADPAAARHLNVEVTRMLSDLAAEVPFFLFSTDLVFDGRVGFYDETATVNPLSVYAETKAEAEECVLRNPRHSVIRTSLNGGTSPTGDRGFNEEMRRAWAAGRSLTLFTDEFRAPMFAGVTARAVWELVLAQRPGLYHLAGRARLSRFEIGRLLAERWPDLQPQVVPGLLKDYSGPPRPPDTTLNCAKAQALLSFPLPDFRDWLAKNPTERF